MLGNLLYKDKKLIIREVYEALRNRKQLSKGDLYELCDFYEPVDIVKILSKLPNVYLKKIDNTIFLVKE